MNHLTPGFHPPSSTGRAWISGITLALVMFVSPAQAGASDARTSVTGSGTADADRLVRLLDSTAWRPSASELLRRYLDPGSAALAAFDAHRIGGPEAMARALEHRGWEYRQAIRKCLPAARSMIPRIPGLLAGIARRFESSETPPVVFVFGAGRSAGTVENGDVILALEVLCRYVDAETPAEAVLEAFLLHEAVHVYQQAAWRPGRPDSLLRQAMMEGLADLVAGEAVGGLLPQERERAAWGRAHEAALWASFEQDMRGRDLGGLDVRAGACRSAA